MNKNELIEAIAAKTGSSKAQAARTVTTLTETITEALQKGDSISLPGFGTFEVRSRSERTGRNPRQASNGRLPPQRCPHSSLAPRSRRQ